MQANMDPISGPVRVHEEEAGPAGAAGGLPPPAADPLASLQAAKPQVPPVPPVGASEVLPPAAAEAVAAPAEEAAPVPPAAPAVPLFTQGSSAPEVPLPATGEALGATADPAAAVPPLAAPVALPEAPAVPVEAPAVPAVVPEAPAAPAVVPEAPVPLATPAELAAPESAAPESAAPESAAPVAPPVAFGVHAAPTPAPAAPAAPAATAAHAAPSMKSRVLPSPPSAKSRVKLQSSSATAEDPVASRVAVDETGYQTVSRLRSNAEMERFALRTASEHHIPITERGSQLLSRHIVPHHSGEKGRQSFARLVEDLRRLSRVHSGQEVMDGPISGTVAFLNETGYQQVRQLGDHQQMQAFIRRMAEATSVSRKFIEGDNLYKMALVHTVSGGGDYHQLARDLRTLAGRARDSDAISAATVQFPSRMVSGLPAQTAHRRMADDKHPLRALKVKGGGELPLMTLWPNRRMAVAISNQ